MSIDDADPRPPYEQLASQLLRLISTGELAPGDRLAPIRQLAGDLSVAPNTVARSYQELERIGVIVSRGRRGTIVADRA
ncbi:MAG: GntR family transcriptional regulator, partial [Actinomycetota bacterium]